MRFDGAPVDQARIVAMARSLTHRGPDGEGFWNEGPVAVGHRRLSIIDLAGSHQPMDSHDGRWVLVFNGEILNYRELRSRLNYPFRTNGDTETLLAGLVQHGIAFVNALVGQFAFAAFDRTTRTLYLVRDRLGILPLYYRATADSLVFASEIKAILAGVTDQVGVDEESLDAYLAARSVPAPFTLFDGIRKVRAAQILEFGPDGSIHECAYWCPPDEDKFFWSPGDAVQAVDRAISTAVAAALVADVPVGAYLSGGVDSSLIVAKAATLRKGQSLQTFAAGFGDPRHDELPWARRVSEHIGTQHHEVAVTPSDFEELWPTLTWHRDAPMSEPADIAVFRLAQEARHQVKVVLSGEGGDELFAGYPKYRAARVMTAASLLPDAVRKRLGDATERRLPEALNRLRIAVRVWSAARGAEQFGAWFAPFSRRERRELMALHAGDRHRSLPHGVWDPVRAMLLGDLIGWLPDNLLERGDRMSMAASLELRPPLLDHRLADLAFRLPSNLKVRSGTTKWVLKEVARRYLPAEVVDRAKVGFRVPLDAWFRSSLQDSVRDRLTSPQAFVAQVFDRKEVRRLIDRHESGKFNEDIRIWTLMSLEVWHDIFFSSRLAPAG